VVGVVAELEGEVTYRVGESDFKEPLSVGQEVRAEWTLHTGPGSRITVTLSNGHTWALAAGLSKRLSEVEALTLAPVREGFLARASDLGAGRGKDRTAAAGLYHERHMAQKAAPTRINVDLDEKTSAPSDEPAPEEVAPGLANEDTGGAPPAQAPAVPAAPLEEPGRREASKTGTLRRPQPTTAPKPDPKALEQLTGSSVGAPGGGHVTGAGGASLPPQKVSGVGAQPKPAPPPPPRLPPTTGQAPTRGPGPKDSRGAKVETADAPDLQQKPSDKQVREALAPFMRRLENILKKHGHKGNVTLVIHVNGSNGNVIRILVNGKAAEPPLFRELRRAVANAKLPRSQRNYSHTLHVSLAR